MGWKASCILINELGPGYLGTMPQHDPERARRLITDLGLGPIRSRGVTTFDYGIYPDHLVVGAYNGAAVIGTPDLINSSEPVGRNPLIQQALKIFPKAAVLSVCLHSMVNLFGYAYFEEGRLLRAYGGAADRGVLVDVGEWLPEERPHFERSAVRDGKRYFYADIDDRVEEFSADAYGETLAFAVMGRFFGCILDEGHPQIDPLELPMESFRSEEPRSWWWPFKRIPFVEAAYRSNLKSLVCHVCGQKPGATALDHHALCPACRRLLDWFRGYYADEKGLDPEKLTAETKFRDLSADSLDYVEWILEAEEQFGVAIPDLDAEQLRSVGDYLGYIRANSGAGSLRERGGLGGPLVRTRCGTGKWTPERWWVLNRDRGDWIDAYPTG